MGFIGYGILLSLIIIPFFLLSHTKKEQIRAHIPFRLSDTQAVVFVASMILTALMILMLISGIYNQIALGGVILKNGFFIAITSTLLIIIAGFFLSRYTKVTNTEMYYLDHHIDDTLQEYRDILTQKSENKEEDKKRNMSLPI